jgi:hypothetical protein
MLDAQCYTSELSRCTVALDMQAFSVTALAALPYACCSRMQVFQTRNEICVFHGYLSNLDDLLDTLTKSGRSKCTLGNPAGAHLNQVVCMMQLCQPSHAYSVLL